MQTVAEVFGTRQSDFVRLISERSTDCSTGWGRGSRRRRATRSENLSKLHERLAVIDAAQQNLKDLTGEVVGLEDVLSNKQTAWRLRAGPHGGDHPRWAAVRRLRVPADPVEPHAARLPRAPAGDERGLVIDAKFPARGFHPVPRGKGGRERGARARGPRRHARPREGHRRRNTSSRARRRTSP